MPDNDFCAGKHKGADTSRDAFKGTSDESRLWQRKKLLEQVKAAGQGGITCEEASRATEIPYTTASARLSEMVHRNIIHDSRERRNTSNGRPAKVLRAGPSPYGPPAPPELSDVERLKRELAELGNQLGRLYGKIGEKRAQLTGAELREKAEQGELF